MTRALTLRLGAVVAALSVVATLGATQSADAAAARRSSVNADSTHARVKADRGVAVTGRVRPHAARPVRVERRIGKTWVKAAAGRSKKDGRFDIPLATDLYVGRTAYRVVAPANQKFKRAVEPVGKINIVSTGKRGQHTFLMNSMFRWNPCQTITYRLNLAKAPAGAKNEVRQALKRVTAQSGQRFRYLGKTRVVPDDDRRNPKGTDLVIAWANPKQSSWLGNTGRAGYGGAWAWRPYAKGPGYLYDGFVLLDAKLYQKFDKGFGMGKPYGYAGTRGQLLMHEIGHSMGMGHVRAKSQVMFPTMHDAKAIWGKGDAANLVNLGLGSGCLRKAPPPPRSGSARLAAPGDRDGEQGVSLGRPVGMS